MNLIKAEIEARIAAFCQGCNFSPGSIAELRELLTAGQFKTITHDSPPWIEYNLPWDDFGFGGQRPCFRKSEFHRPGVEVEIERKGKFLIGHINADDGGQSHGVSYIYPSDIVLRYRVLAPAEALMNHQIKR